MNVSLIGIAPSLIQKCSRHSHDAWEIILNIEGKGTAVVNDREYAFGPGTIMCTPPGIPHYKYSEQHFKDIYIHVNTLVIPVEDGVAIFADDEEKSVETLMLLALRIFHKNDANSASIVDSLNNSIHQLLLSWSERKHRNGSVELFKNQLIKNFTDPEFKLSDALKNTSYCSDHFRRCFKADTGVPPLTYLINLRIEYARKLLAQKDAMDLNIADIALQSGFYDSRYFSRLFKKIVGKSPQTYAKERA